ncbi:effector protein NopP [Bradyrhizobium sp. LMG 9283]|uniref:effector protein NopP n=1 Tax=Bradyrhizobium sp. LMG 9283 TaxID=592064 RepID=UPI00388D1FAD
MDAAYNHGRKAGSDDARHFSYQLGNKSVGLLRTEGGAPVNDVFKGETARARWQEQFPERSEITSTIDFRVTHPLVENAGDILLEHQLRLDGHEPLVLSHPVNPEAKARAAALGFVEISDSLMVLDPTRNPDKWGKNSNGEWQRENKPRLYLSKAEESAGIRNVPAEHEIPRPIGKTMTLCRRRFGASRGRDRPSRSGLYPFSPANCRHRRED